MRAPPVVRDVMWIVVGFYIGVFAAIGYVQTRPKSAPVATAIDHRGPLGQAMTGMTCYDESGRMALATHKKLPRSYCE